MSSSKSLLSRTVYRQLLKWCKHHSRRAPGVPLDPIPPITLQVPEHIDTTTPPRHLIPSTKNADIDETKVVFSLRSVSDIENAVRLSFRLSETANKERLDVALECLRNLNNYLTPAINERHRRRESHGNRDGVAYRVGDVVKHKTEKWRGVIVTWQRDDDGVYYRILLDTGDVTLYNPAFVRYSQTEGGEVHQMAAKQDELEKVSIACLTRIRNSHLETKFSSYDSSRNSFHPRPILAYEYPNDYHPLPTTTTASSSTLSPASSSSINFQTLENNVTQTVHSHAVKLSQILPVTSSSSLLPDREPLLTVRRQLETLLSSPTLSNYLTLSTNIHSLLTHRSILHPHSPPLHPLGATVRHTKYSYRGVVVGWDPTPVVDVRNWDGVGGIENVMKRKFYHVVTVDDDCVKVFGGERRWRYVCEANLESYGDVAFRVEGLDWDMEEGGNGYVAPDDIKFKYAENMGEDGEVIVDVMTKLRNELSMLHHQVPLCQSSLFTLLENATSASKAQTIEEIIKDIWKSHPTNRPTMDHALSHLLRNSATSSLALLDTLVERDPSYTEAWNKKATCHYLLGDMEASETATRQTLKLEPRHFAAWSGLGLIHQDRGERDEAINCYKKSLKWHPWGAVSARLAALIDKGCDSEMEEGSEEGSAPHE